MSSRLARSTILGFLILLVTGSTSLATTDMLVVDGPMTISADDATYDGYDVVVTGETAVLTISGDHVLASLVVTAGGSVEHESLLGLTLTVTHDLEIDAGASIDVSGLGFPTDEGPGAGHSSTYYGSGAGHGGVGGDAAEGVPGGETYGSAANPLALGSGGGSGGETAGGTGGGQVSLAVGGTLTVNGALRADGEDGAAGLTTWPYRSGGGSGGSILIHCASLQGIGTISASGGEAPVNGGGGSGGRIAIYCQDNQFPSEQIDTAGGGGYDDGDGGTAYLGFVVVSPDGTGDYATIQGAADAVDDGTIVLLEDGVFSGDGNRDIDPRGKDLLFRSLSGDAASCIIDCEGSAETPHRGFFIHSGETARTMIAAITIRGGWAAGRDGEGGGILVDGGSFTNVEGVIFSGNRAASGGGGLHYNPESAGKVIDSIFDANIADSGGGGLHYREGSSGSVVNCVFFGNVSGPEAAAANFDGNAVVTLLSCTVVGNTGNGVRFGDQTTASIERSIIAFNTGTSVVCGDAVAITVSCSDIFGNDGGDWTGCIEGLDSDGGPSGGTNISLDPLFVDWPAGDLTLLPDSPCLPDASPCGLLIGADRGGVIGGRAAAPGPGSSQAGSTPRPGVQLGQNYPNPFNPTTTIAFALPHQDQVRLAVYALDGRRVATLISGAVPAGWHTVTWPGTDDAGRAVASGAYLYRLRTSAGLFTRVLTLVK